jgi:hypothetical protein
MLSTDSRTRPAIIPRGGKVAARRRPGAVYLQISAAGRIRSRLTTCSQTPPSSCWFSFALQIDFLIPVALIAAFLCRRSTRLNFEQTATKLVCAALVLTALPVASRAATLDIRTGAWEVTSKFLMEGIMIPKDVLARAPPAQRARIEAAMRARSGSREPSASRLLHGNSIGQTIRVVHRANPLLALQNNDHGASCR